MTPTETTTILRQFNTCVKPRRPMRTAKPISSPLAGRAAMPTGTFLEIAMRLSGQRNQCPSCGEPFNSNAAFDKHRTGQFGKDRRCMSVD